jgi:hypothetical protein
MSTGFGGAYTKKMAEKTKEIEMSKPSDGPEAFDKEVEKRMKKLAANQDMVYRGVDFMVEVKHTMESGAHKATYQSRFQIYEDDIKGNWIVGNKTENEAYQKALNQAHERIDKIVSTKGSKKLASSKDVGSFDYKGYKCVVVENVGMSPSNGKTFYTAECDELRLESRSFNTKSEAIAEIKKDIDAEIK